MSARKSFSFFLSGNWRRKSVSLLFLLQACWIPRLIASIKNQQHQVKTFSYHITLTFSSVSRSSTYKFPVITFSPSEYSRTILFWGQLISNLNSICKINTYLLYKVTYSKIPVIRTWTAFGDHYSAYYRYYINYIIFLCWTCCSINILLKMRKIVISLDLRFHLQDLIIL